MKHEWRKKEKDFYLPKRKAEVIEIPSFKFFTIQGKGNPNDSAFGEYISVLYSLSYAIRMSHKGGFAPDNYFEYTVYPLEGVWDISEEAKKNFTGTIDKDSLIFTLMIRQPEFVTKDFAKEAQERTQNKKPHDLLENVKFTEFEEGKCVQVMHLGSYDNEPETFREMEDFCDENKLIRKTKHHREIYLSDVRKVSPEKLKTVLRFGVK